VGSPKRCAGSPPSADSLGGWQLWVPNVHGKGPNRPVVRVLKDRWGKWPASCPDASQARHGEYKHAKALIAVYLVAPSFRAPNKRPRAFDAIV
jgi:hypothetical protein